MGKSDSDVKLVSAAQFVNSYIAMPCGILVGITVLANSMSYEAEFQKLDGFFMFISEWLHEGNVFLSALMYLLIMAAMAGIMSTADSSLIGVSNTVTVDIFRNWLMPDASSRKIVFVGKIVSIITAMFGAGLAVYLEATKNPDTGVSYSLLLSLQGGIGWQILPAFVLGLYSDISAPVVARGCVLGLVTFLGLAIFNVLIAGADKTDDIETIWTEINPNAEKLNGAVNALAGALVNFAYCFVAHIFRDKTSQRQDAEEEAYDTRYGPEKLTHKRILDTVGDKSEPIFYLSGGPAFVIIVCVGAQFVVRSGPVDGDLKDNILFNGVPNRIVAGLPEWAFLQLVTMLVGSACGLWAIMGWDVSSDEGLHDGDEKAYVELGTSYVQMDADDEL